MASLATTYRPTKFEDVVGQERVKAILQNQIETGEFKNAYLFTGGAGTGKTTTARIIANEINNFEPAPVAENIDFEQFMKLDIRVGKVLECAKVPKADKLLQFKIDDGMGGRTIVSGIAKYYNPEDLVGKEVCFVANLAPRKLKGIESQGMILSAEDAGGRLVVIGPNGEVKPGAQVK